MGSGEGGWGGEKRKRVGGVREWVGEGDEEAKEYI